jgi:hypothetical protein
VKVWLEGLVQVTLQLGPTDAVTETASTVFSTVAGLGEDVAQSGGRLSV